MSDQVSVPTDRYHGLFYSEGLPNGQRRLSRHPHAPVSIPDPTGRQLRVATLDTRATGICPACATIGQGGYVSFVQDLRLAYACPQCEELVWLPGA